MCFGLNKVFLTECSLVICVFGRRSVTWEESAGALLGKARLGTLRQPGNFLRRAAELLLFCLQISPSFSQILSCVFLKNHISLFPKPVLAKLGLGTGKHAEHLFLTSASRKSCFGRLACFHVSSSGRWVRERQDKLRRRKPMHVVY